MKNRRNISFFEQFQCDFVVLYADLEKDWGIVHIIGAPKSDISSCPGYTCKGNDKVPPFSILMAYSWTEKILTLSIYKNI